jgi:hypothetical protein
MSQHFCSPPLSVRNMHGRAPASSQAAVDELTMRIEVRRRRGERWRRGGRADGRANALATPHATPRRLARAAWARDRGGGWPRRRPGGAAGVQRRAIRRGGACARGAEP